RVIARGCPMPSNGYRSGTALLLVVPLGLLPSGPRDLDRVLPPGTWYDEGMKEVTGEPPCHHHGSHGGHLFRAPPFGPLARAGFPTPVGISRGRRRTPPAQVYERGTAFVGSARGGPRRCPEVKGQVRPGSSLAGPERLPLYPARPRRGLVPHG